MSESHLHYYPDHGSALPDYLQEGIPELHESYSLSYQTSTSTNGHHDGDASSNNSESSGVPVDNASLISRSTSQTKTQQVKTVTKIIKTREIHAHHIGPDGKPIIGYSSPYGVEGSDYMPFHYPNPNDYGTYDPGRPPSPAGETPSYSHDYGTYGRTASPSAGRNFDLYSSFRDFPTTPSGAPTDSPNLHRAMPQAPRSVTSDFNHTHLDLEASALGGVPSRLDYRRTPSPTQASDRYGTPYGYAGQPSCLPATPSPGYKYDPGLPEGYLDRRPSFDEHPSSRSPQGPHGTSTYPRRPYEDESHTLGSDGSNLSPIPRPHPHLDYAPESEGDVIRFRDPDLNEIIQFLQHPNSVVRANAAAYLTHICYMDDNMKQKTRSLGGIPPLIDLLNNDLPELKRNACGALKNLSFGRQNDINKRAICDADGIPALVRLLRKSPDNEIRELATSVLWNLSSCEDLKRPILDEALTTLVNHVIIPHSGYDHARNALEELKREGNEIYWSTVFRNASGVIRNISSAGEYTRKKLRNCEGLIEALVYLVRVAVGKNDIDNKSVENAVCILRNLSYRIQEIEDPHYDKHYPPVSSRGGTTPMKGLLSSSYLAVGETLGCFGANTKKKKENAVAVEKEKQRVPLTKNPISENEPIGGMALLYDPEVVECYLSLLSECSNPDTLEAAAGAIMNLAACLWAPSVDIRASVRKSKGLPILVELLKMEVDRVVCAVATALRNLAVDQRNSALIGNYAMKDLIQKLPNGSASHDAGISDDTIAAVLATLNEVVSKQSDFARSLFQIGGVERLHQITQQKKGTYSPRVVKFATQLLYNMWQHQELREAYRKAGWKECHFVPKSRNSLSSPTGANSTLSRPMSSQSGTKYEDRTLPQTELNSTAASIPYSRSEELPLSELSHNSEPPPPPSSNTHRPHIFPSGMQQAPSPSEPVYAQVKKERKSKKSPIQLLSNEQPDGMPAGDSWV